jgi:hypothetical protein
VAFAVWQFYLFVTFKGTNGILDGHGGSGHFWVAIISSILASVAGFFVFSVFVRYDRDDEMHITSVENHPLTPWGEDPVSSVYAMQRANGDWFALDDQGRSRVPLFFNSREAMNARAYNSEMLVFTPVLLNEAGLKTLVPGQGETVDFWLVEKESTNMKRGELMNHTQLVSLVGAS